jgi:hypothetical protein
MTLAKLAHGRPAHVFADNCHYGAAGYLTGRGLKPQEHNIWDEDEGNFESRGISEVHDGY